MSRGPVGDPTPTSDGKMDSRAAAGTQERRWLRILVRLGIVALFALLLWGLITAIDWRAVARGVAGLSPGMWLALVAVSLLRIVAEAWLLATVTPGLGMRRAVLAFLAPAAAASVLPSPADLVARFGMYASWGFSNEDTSVAVLASWVFTTGAKILLPVVGAVGLATIGRSNADLETVAIVAGAVLLGAILLLRVVLRSDRLARNVGGALGKAAGRVARWFRIEAPADLAGDLSDRFARFRQTGGALIRRRWPAATVAALLTQFLQYAILVLSLRGMGIGADQLHLIEIFAAFSVVQLITTIPITPGGVGIAEAAYVALLVVETDRTLAAAVTAGTLVYRLFSWVLIIPLGGLAWVLWRRSLSEKPPSTEAAG